MPAASPQRQSVPPSPGHVRRTPILTAEATGVLVIAVLILILILIRYWHYIPWGAR